MQNRKLPLGSLALLLVVLILLVPIGIVIVAPSDTPSKYSFESRVVQHLGSSLEGKLEYYLVEYVDGEAPARELAVLIDDDYTRPTSRLAVNIGDQLWMQGDLMSHSAFFGEQYLFFDEAQIYVSQVKQNVLWPDQQRRLIILYGAPLTSLLSPLFLMLWLWQIVSSGGTDINGLSLILTTGLIVLTIFAILKNRHRWGVIFVILLGYALGAILLMALSL